MGQSKNLSLWRLERREGRTVRRSEIANDNIRGIISEAPAGSGFTLGDYDIPTIIPFGALDTWAGKSDTDYVWKRTYSDSPISIEDWVHVQQAKGRPVKLAFYENAGHSLFEGPLKKVTVRRGDSIAFEAYQEPPSACSNSMSKMSSHLRRVIWRRDEEPGVDVPSRVRRRLKRTSIQGGGERSVDTDFPGRCANPVANS